MLSAKKSRIQIFGIVAAIVASISLGIVTPAARVAYDYGVNATTLIAFRAAFAVVLLTALMSLLGRRWYVQRDTLKPLLSMTLGILMVAVGYMSSVLFIPVSLSALIFFSFPIIVLFYTILAEKNPPNMSIITAFLAAFFGLFLALGPSFHSLDWRGVLFSAFAAVGASLVMVAGAAAARKIDPLTLTFYSQALCLPIILSILLSFGNIALPNHLFGWAALFAAAIGYIAGISLILLAVRFANPAPVSMVNNLEPIITLVVAGVLLDEYLSYEQYCGGALVLGSVILVTRSATRPKNASLYFNPIKKID